MGRCFEEIGDKEAAFIAKQKVFFVATAPLSEDRYVNVSPKAPGSSLIVLDKHTVAYADLTGSGSETAAHVLENGRMTIMFANIEEGPPKIMRLQGKAKLVLPHELSSSIKRQFPASLVNSPGFRSVFILNVTRMSVSCGYSMPIMEFNKYRTILEDKTNRMGKEKIADIWTESNSFSIDGLPSIGLIRKGAPKSIIPVPEKGFVHGKVPPEPADDEDKDDDKTAALVAQTDEARKNIQRDIPVYKVDRSVLFGVAIAMFATGIICGALLVKHAILTV